MLGREPVQAISNQDLPGFMGITIVSTVLVVAAKRIFDVAQTLLDKRVRLE